MIYQSLTDEILLIVEFQNIAAEYENVFWKSVPWHSRGKEYLWSWKANEYFLEDDVQLIGIGVESFLKPASALPPGAKFYRIFCQNLSDEIMLVGDFWTQWLNAESFFNWTSPTLQKIGSQDLTRPCRWNFLVTAKI